MKQSDALQYFDLKSLCHITAHQIRYYMYFNDLLEIYLENFAGFFSENYQALLIEHYI